MYDGRKGHNEGACFNRSFKLHAEESGEYDQHHHATAGSDEACAKTNGETEEQRNNNTSPVRFFSVSCLVFLCCIRLNKETNTDKKCQKQRKSTQHNISRQPCYITATVYIIRIQANMIQLRFIISQ